MTTPSSMDPELREILDGLATIVASLSDRVDNQGDTLNHINKTATEARQAAFHAKAQTDPKLFEGAVNAATRDTLHRLNSTASALATEQQEARQANQAVQKRLIALEQALLRVLKADQERRRRRWVQLPVLGLGAVLLVLALGLLLPRLAVLHPNICYALGGEYYDWGNSFTSCTIRLG